MIYLVSLIQTESGFEKVCKSITNLRFEDYALSTMIVFSNLDTARIKKLIDKKYIPFENYSIDKFGDWRRQRGSNDLVVFLSEHITLLGGEIEKLKSDSLLKPSAGFITGKFIEFSLRYKVDNIYEPLNYQSLNKKTGLVEIDIAYPYFFVCKGEQFKLLDFNDKSYFGLGLRKLGYQNYLDNEIEVGYDE